MSPRDSHRRRWALAGLTAFVVVDLVLVATALGTNSASNAAVPTAVQAIEARPTPTNAPTATPFPVAEIAPPTRLLAAYDASTVWRTAMGSCPGAGVTPELSTDGGETWAPSADADASAILAMIPTSRSEASMVTRSATDCSPQLVATFVAGDDWKSYPDRLAANWYVDPVDRSEVHSPAGALTAPCEDVVGLAVKDDTAAAALCSDGSFVRTTDGGTRWGAPVVIPGGVNLNVSDDGYILAALDQPECAGVQVLSTSEALDGAVSEVGCREGGLGGRDVAIASSDGAMWIWAGDVMSKSTDDGSTWG